MKKTVLVLILILLVGVVSMRVIENNTAPKLGVSSAQLKPLGSRPNSVSSQTDIGAKQVAPIAFSGSVADQLAKAKNALESMPGAVIEQQESDYLYAVFTSPLMRFKDDVEVYIDESSNLVHFRSASRVGYSDLGVNRKRYEAFALALAKEAK